MCEAAVEGELDVCTRLGGNLTVVVERVQLHERRCVVRAHLWGDTTARTHSRRGARRMNITDLKKRLATAHTKRVAHTPEARECACSKAAGHALPSLPPSHAARTMWFRTASGHNPQASYLAAGQQRLLLGAGPQVHLVPDEDQLALLCARHRRLRVLHVPGGCGCMMVSYVCIEVCC